LRVFFIFFIVLLFQGCNSSSSSDEQESGFEVYTKIKLDYMLPKDPNMAIEYDYYEIANSKIVESILNTDLINLQHILDSAEDYQTTMYKVDENYSLENSVVGVDEVIDALIYYDYNSLTNAHKKTVYKKGFGLYAIQRDFCTISTDSNCTSYMYAKKIEQ